MWPMTALCSCSRNALPDSLRSPRRYITSLLPSPSPLSAPSRRAFFASVLIVSQKNAEEAAPDLAPVPTYMRRSMGLGR